jgi:hypothetical protein
VRPEGTFDVWLAPDERTFDTVAVVLTVEQVEQVRRSSAMAPLSRGEVDRLLESCAEMARERRQIAGILAQLPSNFAKVREALNLLREIVT